MATEKKNKKMNRKTLLGKASDVITTCKVTLIIRNIVDVYRVCFHDWQKCCNHVIMTSHVDLENLSINIFKRDHNLIFKRCKVVVVKKLLKMEWKINTFSFNVYF